MSLCLFLYCSQAVDSGILLLRDLNQAGLPLLNNNGTSAVVDPDSTDASQSPLTHSQPRRPHKYESIDDFSKENRTQSSSSLSHDATPPVASYTPRKPAPPPPTTKKPDSQRMR